MTPGVDQVSLVVPADWWLLPLDPAGRAGLATRMAARLPPGASRQAMRSLLEDLCTRALAAGVVLCAQGLVPIPEGAGGGILGLGGQDQLAANVLLAVRPGGGGPETHLDVIAERLADARLDARPALDICSLPLAGAAARLAWRRPLDRELSGVWVRCVEYWVPFPEDDRAAVMTLTTIPDDPAPAVTALLENLAATLVFADPDGTVVLPQRATVPATKGGPQ